MPSFEIPDASATIALKGGAGTQAPRTGSASYTVTNKTAAALAGRLSIQCDGDTKAEWFTIAGERQRNFSAGESPTVNIAIKVPANVAPGTYKFRLRVVAVNDPDNDVTQSPVATLDVPVPTVVPPPHVPWWVFAIIGGVVLLIIIGVVIYMLMKPKPGPGTASVPDGLIGLSYADASAKLQAVRLTPQKVADSAAGKTPDTVLATDPAANAPVAADKPVVLHVDPGVPMPQLVKMDEAAARSAADARSIFLDMTVSCTNAMIVPGGAGFVSSQTVAPGTPVAKFSHQSVTYLRVVPPNVRCVTFKMSSEMAKAGFARVLQEHLVPAGTPQ